jgi:hypothetical protein
MLHLGHSEIDSQFRVGHSTSDWLGISPFAGRERLKTRERLFRDRNSMNTLIHWLLASGSLLALIVTAGVAVLLVCCLGCVKCPRRDKDDIFSHHGV